MFATARAFAFCDAPGVGDGSMVGNSPAALPPGLRLALGAGVTPLMPGRLPTDSGEVVALGVGGSVMVIAAAALGSFGRCAALPMTVRLTDVTAVAVAGTVTCACSCRAADFESIAPRSHDDVPSKLPQPKLNPGITLRGDACSLMVAWGTFPPVIQAPTVQVAASPRWLLAWARTIWTQSRTTEALATVLAPECCFRVCFGIGEWDGVGLLVGVALWVGLGVWVGVGVWVGLGVWVCVGVGECVGVAVPVLVGVAVPVFVGVAVPVFVGVAVPDGLLDVADGAFVVAFSVPDAVAVGVADWVSVLVAAGVVSVPGLFDRVRFAADVLVAPDAGVVDGAVGVGVAVVGVGVGVGVGVCVAVCVGVGVGVELGGGLGSESAWHDSSLTLAAVTAAE